MPPYCVLLNGVILLAAGLLGYWIGKNRRRAWVGLGIGGMLAGIGPGMALRPDWAVAIFPFGDLLFFTNTFPVGVAVFLPCAFAFARSRPQRVRMAILGSILFLAACKGYEYHYQPLAVSYENLLDADGVVRQSSADTCSAAALATLLRRRGIEATEDVVFLGRDPDRANRVLIGEPDFGLASWPADAFRFLYYGFAASQEWDGGERIGSVR